MAIPKTNLFKGDRVKLSKTYLVQKDLTTKGVNGAGGFVKARRERIGTIVNDTLSPTANYIRVHWDGNVKAGHHDCYMPDDLVLVEDEEDDLNDNMDRTEIPRRRCARAIAHPWLPCWYGNHPAFLQQRLRRLVSTRA